MSGFQPSSLPLHQPRAFGLGWYSARFQRAQGGRLRKLDRLMGVPRGRVWGLVDSIGLELEEGACVDDESMDPFYFDCLPAWVDSIWVSAGADLPQRRHTGAGKREHWR